MEANPGRDRGGAAMIDKPQLKDSVILQQAWQIGPFADMLRLTYQRHAAYAWAHNMEYIAWAGSLKPEMWPGGWGKIWLFQLMLEQGYKYIFWIDTDRSEEHTSELQSR